MSFLQTELIDPASFVARPTSDLVDSKEISRVSGDLRQMVLAVLDAILKRCESNPDYPFIDTKLSLIDGKDFPDDDAVRGKQTVYAWIQGRGLEALVGHDAWLSRTRNVAPDLVNNLRPRIANLISRVFEQTERMRQANGGRLFFMMSTDGKPRRLGDDGGLVDHQIDPDAPANFSDLFYSKGMIAAATYLGDTQRQEQACEWFCRIADDIMKGRFQTDQQPLDIRNPAIRQVPGRNAQGPWMIAVGAAATFVECTSDSTFAEIGFKLLDHILSRHVNVDGRVEYLRPCDMWEFIDDDGNPYQKDGAVISDPGHATEFAGLGLKFLAACQKTGTLAGRQDEARKALTDALTGLLVQNFDNGFSSKGLGIAKAVDLLKRDVVLSDMPWWSLPETMRAAVEACEVAPDRKPEFRQVFAKCFNAFVSHYVKPSLDLMAVQTLGADGSVSASIPATPDADPAYHTGLSLIDCIERIDALG